jgi:hypothetical protein
MYEAQICSVIAYVYGGRCSFIAATRQNLTPYMPEIMNTDGVSSNVKMLSKCCPASSRLASQPPSPAAALFALENRYTHFKVTGTASLMLLAAFSAYGCRFDRNRSSLCAR